MAGRVSLGPGERLKACAGAGGAGGAANTNGGNSNRNGQPGVDGFVLIDILR